MNKIDPVRIWGCVRLPPTAAQPHNIDSESIKIAQKVTGHSEIVILIDKPISGARKLLFLPNRLRKLTRKRYSSSIFMRKIVIGHCKSANGNALAQVSASHVRFRGLLGRGGMGEAL